MPTDIEVFVPASDVNSGDSLFIRAMRAIPGGDLTVLVDRAAQLNSWYAAIQSGRHPAPAYLKLNGVRVEFEGCVGGWTVRVTR